MSDTTQSGHTDASTIVAQSLSTVGYAMFSLLRSGPLNEIPSFTTFMSNVGNDLPGSPAVEETYDADDHVSFGASTVDDNLGAVTPVIPPTSVPLPASLGRPVGSSATSAMVSYGPDGRPMPEAELAPDQPEQTEDQYSVPLPEYSNSNGSHTIAMLKEISFLDE